MSGVHTCSKATEHCSTCGYADSRDAFEGWTVPFGFTAICPDCEAWHLDQTNHDDQECEACTEVAA